MKKFLFTTIILFFCFTVFSQPIDANSAQWYAEQWLSLAEQKTLNDLQCVYTQSNESKSQNYFYIFSSTAENTFIIVSADERILPVLGYSNESAFDPDNIPSNMQNWLDGYVNEMKYVFSFSDVDKHPEWKNISNGEITKGTNAVEPLINLRWNQSPYYNHFCPGNCAAGCVATAMSMIMKYWNHPVHGFGQSSYYHDTYGLLSADYENTYYEWDNMPVSATSSNYLAIAELMYHCGVSVEMGYCSSGTASGAYTSDVADALVNYFGYQTNCCYKSRDYYPTYQWENMMRSELDLGKPMEYRGSGSGGHAFVLDGYDDNNKFHFNWGWGGTSNGYFSLDNLNPSGHDYNEWQGAVMNIEPRWELYCEFPNNIEVTYTEDCEAIITWDALSNSEGYDIYRNDTLIASNVLTTSYTDQGFEISAGHTWGVSSKCNNGWPSVPANSPQLACAPEPPSITTFSLNDGKVGTGYNKTLTASGTTPIFWSIVNGDLPTGLTLIENIGRISGIPTTAGTFNFTIRATNYAGNDEREFSILIIGTIVIITETLPNGKVGTGYNQMLTATGIAPINWTVQSGKLPDGLSLNTNGILSGNPTKVGTYNFIARATNSSGSVSKPLNIIIENGVGITEINASNIKVYPNPANYELRITNYELKANNYRIYSVVGQMVMDGKLQGEITSINVKSLANGIYYLRIADDVVTFVKE